MCNQIILSGICRSLLCKIEFSFCPLSTSGWGKEDSVKRSQEWETRTWTLFTSSLVLLGFFLQNAVATNMLIREKKVKLNVQHYGDIIRMMFCFFSWLFWGNSHRILRVHCSESKLDQKFICCVTVNNFLESLHIHFINKMKMDSVIM